MWPFSAHVTGWMNAFFSQIDIQLLALSGCLGLDRHSCWGSRIISRVCVPQLSSMAAIVSPLRCLGPAATGTNPRLFWARGHRQCGQPTLCIPAPYLCQGPWVLHRGPALQGQTDAALCTRQSPSRF